MTVEINEDLVRALVRAQFPQWGHLSIHRVPRSGWDNRTFRLGENLVVRLPSAQEYESQVHREHRWLPELGRALPLRIPGPVALGRPGHGYPWAWSVYRWIPGVSAAEQAPGDGASFAGQLAGFLIALHRVSTTDGPAPGPNNFHRGGSLMIYDAQLREALRILQGRIDTATALAAWEDASSTAWDRAPVWVHGDFAPGNLLMRENRLAAVIDFGQVCVGDPACDLAIAWTFLRGDDRLAFQADLGLDTATWRRGRAWALWKAAIVAAELTQTNAVEGLACWETLAEVLEECCGNAQLTAHVRAARPRGIRPLQVLKPFQTEKWAGPRGARPSLP